MATVDKKFIVKLQGKDFVQYEGLLDTAHQMGLIGISTELVQLPNKENGGQCIVKATAKTKNGGEFQGYGDADPSNVNRMIARHIIRMAETRAKARALRDLTNIGMTAIEELGGEESGNPKPAPAPSTPKPKGNKVSDPQVNKIHALLKEVGIDENTYKSNLKKNYRVESTKELTKQQASKMIENLERIKNQKESA